MALLILSLLVFLPLLAKAFYAGDYLNLRFNRRSLNVQQQMLEGNYLERVKKTQLMDAREEFFSKITALNKASMIGNWQQVLRSTLQDEEDKLNERTEQYCGVNNCLALSPVMRSYYAVLEQFAEEKSAQDLSNSLLQNTVAYLGQAASYYEEAALQVSVVACENNLDESKETCKVSDQQAYSCCEETKQEFLKVSYQGNCRMCQLPPSSENLTKMFQELIERIKDLQSGEKERNMPQDIQRAFREGAGLNKIKPSLAEYKQMFGGDILGRSSLPDGGMIMPGGIAAGIKGLSNAFLLGRSAKDLGDFVKEGGPDTTWMESLSAFLSSEQETAEKYKEAATAGATGIRYQEAGDVNRTNKTILQDIKGNIEECATQAGDIADFLETLSRNYCPYAL